MVVYPNCHILDVVGPIEVLTGSGLFMPQQKVPYQITVVSNNAGMVPTTCGIALAADKSFASARRSRQPIDTLIVAGGHGTTAVLNNQALLDYVQWASLKANRVVSICTGAMILAELGLLDNRRATTHWFWCPILAKRYPNVQVDPDAIFVRDGHIWTSAGVTAGMDLSLALIEEDLGHDIALKIARYNVMYMIRPGGQTQFSTQLLAQQHADGPLADTLAYINSHPRENLNVTAMAAHACMSERSFARKFKEATHMTPAHYVELIRLDLARVELEQTHHGIEQVAINTGFASAEVMRRAFQRHLGISASDYRERFQSTHLNLQSGSNSRKPNKHPP
ncbi:MAG: GlxA family transcriptional regulator [Pseudomonadales bacterium]|nr:GlxA family transcriptional regulator [Pseudomonadales bacterium]